MSGPVRFTPRHLRFAQALALVSGLGACGARTTEPVTRPLPRATVPSRPTVASPTDACPCTCTPGSSNPAYCGDIGHGECCGGMDSGWIVGPLPPPDLRG